MFNFQAKRRLEALEDDFRTMKHTIEGLKFEWTDTLHRMQKMLGRIVKSAQRMEDIEAMAGKSPQDGSGPTNSGALGPQASQTQLTVQQRILARRRQPGMFIRPEDVEEKT